MEAAAHPVLGPFLGWAISWLLPSFFQPPDASTLASGPLQLRPWPAKEATILAPSAGKVQVDESRTEDETKHCQESSPVNLLRNARGFLKEVTI